MLHAKRMNMDGHTTLGKDPGCSSVIQMNVRNAAGIQIFDTHRVRCKSLLKIHDRVGRPGLDQDGGTLIIADEVCTNRAGQIHVQEVEVGDVDGHGSHPELRACDPW